MNSELAYYNNKNSLVDVIHFDFRYGIQSKVKIILATDFDNKTSVISILYCQYDT